MKREHAAFAERLRRMLIEQKFDMNRLELSRRLALHGKVSVTPQTMSGWLSGKHQPKPDAMRGLAVMLGTEPHLLQFGDRPVAQGREPRTSWPDHMKGPDRLACEAYMALPAKQREAIRALIEALAAEQK
jgi:hypothetical protein